MRDAREMLAQAQAFQDAGDYYSLRRSAEWIILEAERLGDQWALGRALTFLGVAEMRTGESEQARELLTRAELIFEERGDLKELTGAKMNLGTLALDVNGNVEEAKRKYQEVLLILADLHDPVREGIACANIAEICRAELAFDDAATFAQNALDLFAESGSDWRRALTLVTLAHLHALRGEIVDAVSRMEEARDTIFASSNPTSIAIYCEVYAFIAIAHDDIDVGAEVLGFVSSYRSHYDLVEDRGLARWRSDAYETVARLRSPQEREALGVRGSRLHLKEVRAILAQALAVPG